MRRVVGSVAGAVLLVGLIAPSAFAARPVHEAVSDPGPLPFAAGEVCADPVTLSTPQLSSRLTTFAPARDGSQRSVERGYSRTLVTNEVTGATFVLSGGYSTTITVAADGAVHAAGTGSHFAWYFEGDDSDLGPGLWAVRGLATEDYAPDGTFLFATFRGRAIDACAAVGAN